MADKNLNIGAKVDPRGFNELNQQLEKLMKTAEKLTGSLRGIQIGAQQNKNHPDSFMSSLQGAVNLFDKFHKTIQDTDKTLVHGTQKNLLTTGRHFRDVTNEIDKAHQATQRFGAAANAAFGAAAGMGGRPNASMFGARFMFGGGGGGAGNGGGGALGPGGPLGLPPGPPGGGGGVGGGGPPWYTQSNNWRNASAGFNAAGQASNAVANYLQLDYQRGAALRDQPIENLVRAQSFRDTMHSYGKGAPGMLSYMMLTQRHNLRTKESGMPVLDKDGKVIGEGSRGAGDETQALNSLISKAMNNNPELSREQAKTAHAVGGILGGIGQAAGSVGNGVAMGGTAGVVGAIPGVVNGVGNAAMGGMHMAAAGDYRRYGGFEAEQSERMSAMVRRMEALMTPEDKDTFSNLQNMAGMRVAASRAMAGRHKGIMSMGGEYGLDEGTSYALGGALSAGFGARRATGKGGYISQAMKLGTKGFDMSAAGSIVGQIGSAGGNGMEVMEQIMARGVSRGMSNLDVAFFQKIGMAVADNSITALGKNSGKGLADYFSASLDKNSTAADVDASRRSTNALDKFSSMPYYQTRSMFHAQQVLGNQADGYQLQAFGQMKGADWISALRGESEGLKNLGVNGGQQREVSKRHFMDIFRSLQQGDGAWSTKLREKAQAAGGSENLLAQQFHLRHHGNKQERSEAMQFFKEIGTRGAVSGGVDANQMIAVFQGIAGGMEDPMSMKDIAKGSKGVKAVSDRNAVLAVRKGVRERQDAWSNEKKIAEKAAQEIEHQKMQDRGDQGPPTQGDPSKAWETLLDIQQRVRQEMGQLQSTYDSANKAAEALVAVSEALVSIAENGPDAAQKIHDMKEKLKNQRSRQLEERTTSTPSTPNNDPWRVKPGQTR